mmetsp:Transcript_22222/g.50278  ORF Transcript_22222/g.50278 Transcript_22222/m.50278 type:complete len:290 (-) Transcript_22222:838-1707(-)
MIRPPPPPSQVREGKWTLADLTNALFLISLLAFRCNIVCSPGGWGDLFLKKPPQRERESRQASHSSFFAPSPSSRASSVISGCWAPALGVPAVEPTRVWARVAGWLECRPKTCEKSRRSSARACFALRPSARFSGLRPMAPQRSSCVSGIPPGPRSGWSKPDGSIWWVRSHFSVFFNGSQFNPIWVFLILSASSWRTSCHSVGASLRSLEPGSIEAYARTFSSRMVAICWYWRAAVLKASALVLRAFALLLRLMMEPVKLSKKATSITACPNLTNKGVPALNPIMVAVP